MGAGVCMFLSAYFVFHKYLISLSDPLIEYAFKPRSLQIMKTVLHNTYVCIILYFVLLCVRVLLTFKYNK
jgi:hypothetical protein